MTVIKIKGLMQQVDFQPTGPNTISHTCPICNIITNITLIQIPDKPKVVTVKGKNYTLNGSCRIDKQITHSCKHFVATQEDRQYGFTCWFADDAWFT